MNTIKNFYYYIFAVKLDRFVGSCNTLNGLSNKVCVPNKTKDLNLSVFNMITGNNDKCRCECKKHDMYEKDYIWNPSTCSCKNGKYLASIIDDSVITCDEIIDDEAKSNDKETLTVPINFE